MIITERQWNTAIGRAIGTWRRSHVARRTSFPTNATISNHCTSVIIESMGDKVLRVRENWREVIKEYVGAHAKVLIA